MIYGTRYRQYQNAQCPNDLKLCSTGGIREFSASLRTRRLMNNDVIGEPRTFNDWTKYAYLARTRKKRKYWPRKFLDFHAWPLVSRKTGWNAHGIHRVFRNWWCNRGRVDSTWKEKINESRNKRIKFSHSSHRFRENRVRKLNILEFNLINFVNDRHENILCNKISKNDRVNFTLKMSFSENTFP